ncbi:MAG: hypothetical protein U9P50_02720 [Patescibacteria group bacterium]|nr:hypothetical protein [Patescibacteria group bacterium]
MILRKTIVLQQFKVGEKVINREKASQGKRKTLIIEKVLPEGNIKFKGEKGKFNPHNYERV